MTWFVHGVLLLWLVIVPCACFTRYPRHVVLGLALVLGLLFLPMVGESAHDESNLQFAALAIPGLSFLSFTKYKVISMALLLAVFVSEPERLLQLRPTWVDLPMIFWCLVPFPSILGGPPPPDGSAPLNQAVAQSVGHFLLWGAPYLIGKMYFSTPERIPALAAVFLFGALLYAPLCLYEVRMSPTLHNRVYGFAQHDFAQTIRFSGYRPMVFLQHGLAVGMVLTAGLVVGVVVWWGRAVPRLPGAFWTRSRYVFPCLVVGLLITTVLTKSTGALILGMAGIGVLAAAAWLRTSWPFYCLLLICPLYLGTRISGVWTGADLVPLLTELTDEERASSFLFRQVNEDMLMQRAAEGPPFGWGGWARNFVRDKSGMTIATPDGMWIIVLGVNGIPGLTAFYLSLLLPVIRFLWLQPVSLWFRPWCAAATACAMVVVLYMVDNLMNAMNNHVFVAMAGALSAFPRVSATDPSQPRSGTHPQLTQPLSITDRSVFQRTLSRSRLQRASKIRPSQQGNEPQ